MTLLFALCAAIWAIRLGPSLLVGLPPVSGIGNHLIGGVYAIAVFGSFVAITVLFQTGIGYLLSAMAIVWVADIGAYFCGKAFGKHKLAPSISPGKSWEGAIGGWLAVLVFAWTAAALDDQGATFFSHVQDGWGAVGMFSVMTLLAAASVVGDLFESQLKRRIGMKDSSNLLPGHGGILDRVDALIPVLPVIVLLDSWI
jgi:phosphatidate cytidylyltransferase